jgi:hypothetical protein
LTITDNNGGIGRDSVKIAVVNYFRYEEELSINPNPVISGAHIKCLSDSTGNMLIRILDMNGNHVFSLEVVKSQSYFEKDIQLNMLKAGPYYLEAIIGNGKRMVKKFIKQ